MVIAQMTSRQKYTLRWFGEHAMAAIAIGTVLSVIGSAVWFLMRDELQVQVQTLAGVPGFTKTLEGMSSSMDGLKRAVTANTEAIAAITPKDRVAEYDLQRSEIIHPCIPGKLCDYRIRVRRTHFGEPCNAPVVLQRLVIDKFGLQHPVDQGVNRAPTRRSGEWATVSAAFVAPIDAPIGFAEFTMTLEYNCFGATIVEETPLLPFELVKG